MVNTENRIFALNFAQEIEKDGIRFPLNMDTPYAVGQVLNQEPGKLRIKDLRDGRSRLLAMTKTSLPSHG